MWGIFGPSDGLFANWARVSQVSFTIGERLQIWFHWNRQGELLKSVVAMVTVNISYWWVHVVTVLLTLRISLFLAWISEWRPSWPFESCAISFYKGRHWICPRVWLSGSLSGSFFIPVTNLQLSRAKKRLAWGLVAYLFSPFFQRWMRLRPQVPQGQGGLGKALWRQSDRDRGSHPRNHWSIWDLHQGVWQDAPLQEGRRRIRRHGRQAGEDLRRRPRGHQCLDSLDADDVMTPGHKVIPDLGF